MPRFDITLIRVHHPTYTVIADTIEKAWEEYSAGGAVQTGDYVEAANIEDILQDGQPFPSSQLPKGCVIGSPPPEAHRG